MIRDPFYCKIIERLDARLDPELFEQCAADLLRAIYPTLVPIRGGTDAGMDGAIADGEGEPFPLVSTTDERVIRNLTRSLNSYLKDGGLRRKVVLATSQSLTPRRERNLYRRASELGFVLVDVHSQAAMANLLYRSPKWCRELLSLSGDPSPLSVVPLTDRPLLDLVLIGRDVDLAWLQDTDEDRLLVGQPGAGKTFLLHKLALEGDSLFVISDDRGEIAEAIRSEHPTVLIVDDAQVRHDLLVSLMQMREAIGAEYSILASCWPGDEEAITGALGLPSAKVHHLEPLTRDEIVEVINEVGVGGPSRLIHEIVDQAEGRPGLAVTLAHLCLQEGVREVASGDALSRSLGSFFDRVVGRQVKEILAAFSVGGRVGMSMTVVAEALGLGLTTVREAAVWLATGGVIRDVGQDRLSVRPTALRDVLVRDVFCSGAVSLPIEPLIRKAPSYSDVACTLIGARAWGGDVPLELLTGILERADSERAWQQFVWSGRDEAVWALRKYPKRAITFARPALHWAPELVIPLLLTAAVGDDRPLHSTTEHPLRLIEDWIHAGRSGTGQVFERRTVLARSVQAWLSGGGRIEVGLRAFQSVLSPKFEYHTVDPGLGNTVAMYFGYPLVQEIQTMQTLWPGILKALQESGIENWEPIRSMVEAWIYPERVIPSDLHNVMRSFAGQMLCDIVLIAKDRPSVMHWIAQMVKQLDLEIEVPLDAGFETLYPAEDLQNWEAAEKQQNLAVQELARAWVGLDPKWVAERISAIEREAESAGRMWPRRTPVLCQELARNTMSPNSWIHAFIDAGTTADLLIPFLQKAAVIKEPRWIDLTLLCLEQPSFRGAAISVVLMLADPPEELLSEVLRNLSGFGQFIRTCCIRNQIPEHTVERLLRHGDLAISGAAALGEWRADPKGTVRDSLQEAWRDAVLNVVEDDYHLAEILRENPDLAYNWLRNRILEDYPPIFRYKRAIRAVTDVLDLDAKRSILRQLPETYEVAKVVASLIDEDEDLDLYRELLNTERLEILHLVPLAGTIEEIWAEKAKLALDAGYQPGEIAGAAYGYPMSVTVKWGKESMMWAEWIERWTRICSHEDEQIREVGEAGKGFAQARYEEALKRERDEAVYGSDWDLR